MPRKKSKEEQANLTLARSNGDQPRSDGWEDGEAQGPVIVDRLLCLELKDAARQLAEANKNFDRVREAFALIQQVVQQTINNDPTIQEALKRREAVLDAIAEQHGIDLRLGGSLNADTGEYDPKDN